MNVDQDLLEQIATSFEKQAANYEEFKAKHVSRIDALEAELQAEALKNARPFGRPATGKPGPLPQFIDMKSRRPITVLGRDDSMAALEKKEGIDAMPSVGRVLRGIVCGSNAHDADQLAEERKALNIGTDTQGGYTVAGALSGQWIDLMRANMALAQAGVTTVPMENNSLTLAKLTGDPTVTWHAENANLAASDPTLGAVTLRAKTAVCLVKLSLELSQDSANIEQILERSVTAALAQAVDAAGLVGVTEDAAAAAGYGIFNLADRNTVLAVGAPTSWDWAVDAMYELLADNVPIERIGAMIAHPALWKKMRKLKTGIASDNTPLTMPDEVAKLRKLWTTAAPLIGGTTTKAVMGDWQDLLFGVRKNITVQLLNQSFMGSNLQLALLAYVRCDFAATRAQSFVTAEGITI